MELAYFIYAFLSAALLIEATDRFPDDDTPLARIKQFDHTYRILSGTRPQPVPYKPLPTKKEVQEAKEQERTKKEREKAINKLKAAFSRRVQ